MNLSVGFVAGSSHADSPVPKTPNGARNQKKPRQVLLRFPCCVSLYLHWWCPQTEQEVCDQCNYIPFCEPSGNEGPQHIPQRHKASANPLPFSSFLQAHHIARDDQRQIPDSATRYACHCPHDIQHGRCSGEASYQFRDGEEGACADEKCRSPKDIRHTAIEDGEYGGGDEGRGCGPGNCIACVQVFGDDGEDGRETVCVHVHNAKDGAKSDHDNCEARARQEVFLFMEAMFSFLLQCHFSSGIFSAMNCGFVFS